MSDLKDLAGKVVDEDGTKTLDSDPEKGKAQLKELVNKVVKANHDEAPDTKLAEDDVEGAIMAKMGSVPAWALPEKYRK